MSTTGDKVTPLTKLLKIKTDWIRHQLLVMDDGRLFQPYSDSELHLLEVLRGEPKTISDIARLWGVSRQAVHKSVKSLRQKNILDIVPAPGSKRDKLVIFTPAGQEGVAEIHRRFRAIEEKIAKKIGAKSLDELRTILAMDWDD